ncbi:MAG: ATP-binding cassette domain-containing protein [Lachnospiraceae bacterium]
MGAGIIICGLNGCGKSTLGKALAGKLNYHFIDNEDLYFPKTDHNYIYDSPRSRQEVERLFFNEIRTHENFIFASVKGDYGENSCKLSFLFEPPRRQEEYYGKKILRG